MTEKTVKVGHVYGDCDVYIGRGEGGEKHMLNTDPEKKGWLGNPYTVEEHGRNEAIELYSRDFHMKIRENEQFRAAVRSLTGTLGCFCRHSNEDKPDCHGDVIADYVNLWNRNADK